MTRDSTASNGWGVALTGWASLLRVDALTRESAFPLAINTPTRNKIRTNRKTGGIRDMVFMGILF
jgi:hypothetical protein